MFRNNPTFQLAMSLLTMFVFFTFQVLGRPYLSYGDAKKVYAAPDTQALLAKAQAAREALSRGRQKKDNWRDIADSDMSAGVKASVAYFWNYNTVEASLLFSAVLVNLAGLMFAGIPDDGSDFYDGHKRTITVLLVLNVVFAITYYCLVFILEFFTKSSSFEKCLKSCCCRVLCCCLRKRIDRFLERAQEEEDLRNKNDVDNLDPDNMVFAPNPMMNKSSSNVKDDSADKDVSWDKLLHAQAELEGARKQIDDLTDQLRKFKKKEEMSMSQFKPKKKDKKPKKRLFGQAEASPQLLGGKAAGSGGGGFEMAELGGQAVDTKQADAAKERRLSNVPKTGSFKSNPASTVPSDLL